MSHHFTIFQFIIILLTSTPAHLQMQSFVPVLLPTVPTISPSIFLPPAEFSSNRDHPPVQADDYSSRSEQAMHHPPAFREAACDCLFHLTSALEFIPIPKRLHTMVSILLPTMTCNIIILLHSSFILLNTKSV